MRLNKARMTLIQMNSNTRKPGVGMMAFMLKVVTLMSPSCTGTAASWPGQGDQRHAAARITAQLNRVDGHGLCPPKTSYQEHERSQRVEMDERIQADPTQALGRVVAQTQGRHGMRQLMHRKGDE